MTRAVVSAVLAAALAGGIAIAGAGHPTGRSQHPRPDDGVTAVGSWETFRPRGTACC